MKIRISVTLSEELLKAIDRRVKQQRKTRSACVEAAVQAFIGQRTRQEQNARDLEYINEHADSLNREAWDVLEYSARAMRSNEDIVREEI